LPIRKSKGVPEFIYFVNNKKNKLQELFGALKARLEGKEVRFGTIEEMEQQESP
jgi:hypothetical protein